MYKTYSQTFEVGDRILCFDSGKSILLCREAKESKNLWIKKITDVSQIDNLIEDSSQYYLSCESADNRGYYLALDKATGSTDWFIPGKAYFQIIYDGYLYLIFADEKKEFYLLKVERSDGKKTWYHRVDEDLCEYSFRPERILLKYDSGKTEKISPATGAIIR
jgi:outer membrane protein assembly factor BamB